MEKLRNQQVKNFLTVTMLSAGMPMMLMGDEARRTQLGNNNAYCQDNETSWFDWTLLAKHADVHRFVTQLNARRLLRDLEPEGQRDQDDYSFRCSIEARLQVSVRVASENGNMASMPSPRKFST